MYHDPCSYLCGCCGGGGGREGGRLGTFFCEVAHREWRYRLSRRYSPTDATPFSPREYSPSRYSSDSRRLKIESKGERARGRSTCNRDETRGSASGEITAPFGAGTRDGSLPPFPLSVSLSLSPLFLRVAKSLKFIPRAASKEDNGR